MSRVLLAMSGGVDSSVAAHLLLEAGHEVVGLFMRHGQVFEPACAVETVAASRAGTRQSARSAGSLGSLPIVEPTSPHKQGCCSASDAADARRVADRLDIRFYAVDFTGDFDRIVDYFVDEYSRGRTPNPCVMCNNWIKFGRLAEYADGVGAEFIATGHYARMEGGTAERRLRRGIDADKDQSYVLFGIDRDVLPRIMLPVGEYDKSTVRALAGRLGLGVAAKKDSQEICFVAPGAHADFVRSQSSADTSGELVLSDGTVVGHHDGIESFTIGQRKGLGVTFGEPRFVVRIEADTRRVVIGHREELARVELAASETNWLVGEADFERAGYEFACHAQIRYNSRAAAARARVLPEGRLHIRFDEPQLGVAPGQAVVCYEGDRVLGGGWID
ncbi:MAG: tRNA 2-thiouridine(34) synthase MnmA [Pirellulales bacterium]